MTSTVTLTLTDDEALDMRLALNATAIHWGGKARDASDNETAATCQHIRTQYHHLWEKVAVAMDEATMTRVVCANALSAETGEGKSGG